MDTGNSTSSRGRNSYASRGTPAARSGSGINAASALGRPPSVSRQSAAQQLSSQGHGAQAQGFDSARPSDPTLGASWGEGGGASTSGQWDAATAAAAASYSGGGGGGGSASSPSPWGAPPQQQQLVTYPAAYPAPPAMSAGSFATAQTTGSVPSLWPQQQQLATYPGSPAMSASNASFAPTGYSGGGSTRSYGPIQVVRNQDGVTISLSHQTISQIKSFIQQGDEFVTRVWSHMPKKQRVELRENLKEAASNLGKKGLQSAFHMATGQHMPDETAAFLVEEGAKKIGNKFKKTYNKFIKGSPAAEPTADPSTIANYAASFQGSGILQNFMPQQSHMPAMSYTSGHGGTSSAVPLSRISTGIVDQDTGQEVERMIYPNGSERYVVPSTEHRAPDGGPLFMDVTPEHSNG